MSKIIDIGSVKLDLSTISNEKEMKPDFDISKIHLPPVESYVSNTIIPDIPEIPQVSIENTPERRCKIIMIHRYIKSFPIELSIFNIDLETKTSEELDKLLEEIRLIVGNKNSTQLMFLGYQQGLSILENVGPLLNMDLQGIQLMAIQDRAIMDCVQELSIEYMSMKYMKPHIRLAILTGGLCMKVSNSNKTQKILNNFQEKEVQENIVEEYLDL